MQGLQIFNNEKFGSVRTMEEDGKILFCGSDVARALGYARPKDAIAAHCKGAVKRRTLTNGGAQEMSFLFEGDVYRLITHSKLESAQEFESWVFEEVLPTIRKTGGYVSNDDLFIQTYLTNSDESTRELFRSTLAVVRNLNNKIEQDKPKVLFANAVEASHTSILVRDLAKLIRQNGVEIGQNRMFKWLRDNGYLLRDNTPTQYSMERGWFEIKENTVENKDGGVIIKRTTKVTGRGQTYFVNKFLSEVVA